MRQGRARFWPTWRHRWRRRRGCMRRGVQVGMRSRTTRRKRRRWQACSPRSLARESYTCRCPSTRTFIHPRHPRIWATRALDMARWMQTMARLFTMIRLAISNGFRFKFKIRWSRVCNTLQVCVRSIKMRKRRAQGPRETTIAVLHRRVLAPRRAMLPVCL